MRRVSPIQAVVFDLDGLMFNTEELYQQVGGEILRRRGAALTPQLLDAMMGRPSPVALQIMIDWHRLDATVAQLERETDEIFEQILDRQLAPMPGLLPLLDALEGAEIPKAIATSSRRSFVANVLSRFQFEPRFAFILTAEDVRQGKPHPEIYLTAAARFAVPPGEMMVLEDSENGCRAAVAAGAFTVAVPAGQTRRHRFEGAAIVADTLADPRVYAALGLPRSAAAAEGMTTGVPAAVTSSDPSAFVFHAASEADTERLGRALAEVLPDGVTVALVGTLGAGKTRLVKAIAAAAGIDPAEVISPTFVLCREHRGRRTLYHLDAYRIRDDDEFRELGPDEYFDDPQAMTFLEWADRVADCLPPQRIEIAVEVLGDSARRFRITAVGADHRAAVARLARRLAARDAT